jgi:metal-dependent amidase/aminoacylase/carboxypeptidase family protein
MQGARLKAGGRAFAHIAQYHPELIALRRDLHAHPELGFEEIYTSTRVKEALKLCGVDEIHDGIGRTGVVGVIRGRSTSSGSMVGLRADMDALPLTEHNDFSWKSCKQGLMHGRFPVQSIFAMHNWPAMKPGTVGINSGPMMAAADRFTIEITGRGGHGAHAYQTVDVVLVAAHIITAAQSIVSRNVRPIESAVVSLCAVQAGDLGAFSVLPGSATLVGTVRTFDPQVQELVEKRLKELCNAIALGFGATATVQYERIYPATINTESEAIFAGDVAESLLGADHVVRDLEPSMGAEDFSFMLQDKPGAYLRIGQGTGASGSALHNSRYDFNDDILPLGSALHASLIEQAMPLATP